MKNTKLFNFLAKKLSFLVPNHDAKVVIITIGILLALLAALAAANSYFTPPPVKLTSIGQQFNEADVIGSGGKLFAIPAACDKTPKMIESISSVGFTPHLMGIGLDITQKTFVVTFWSHRSIDAGTAVIVTTSHDSDITCIISISNNVTAVQKKAVEATDEEWTAVQKEAIEATDEEWKNTNPIL